MACTLSFSSTQEIKATPEIIAAATSTTRPALSATSTKQTPPDEIANLKHQWAVSAVAESYSEQAAYTVGEPDSENCEFSPLESVWIYPSNFYPNARDFLQLFYADPVIPTRVDIHFAYTFNAIVNIALIDLDGNPHDIYEGTPAALSACPSTLTIDLTDFTEPVYAVRLDFDTLNPEEEGNLTAIDAVEMIGTPLISARPTPESTPYLTVSNLGFNASQVPEGYVYFEVSDKNTNTTLSATQCDAFSYNLTETERIIRFFSCDDTTEIWLYLPYQLTVGELPLNTYANIPTARLFYKNHFTPAMEGSFWLDQMGESTLTGVLEFAGFDPEDSGAYYGVVAVFNQIPIDDKAAQKPGDMITQWADKVTASSELTPNAYAATQALGTSDTWQNCQEDVTAWKPAPSDDQRWIELYFETPVQPEVLNILFTEDPQSIIAVNLLSETDYFPLDLTTSRILEGCPTALVFDPIDEIPLAVIGVQIILDESTQADQLGIDAVQMIGVISD